MAALLLWESRAGGALLTQYPPPNNPIHLQTPLAPAPKEALSRPDRRIDEKIDGGSWTEAPEKVGFAHTYIVLKASLASTYLTCHGDGSIILLWGVKEKKAVKKFRWHKRSVES